MPTTKTQPRRGRQPRTTLITRLDALARNLWWTWNRTPQRLFAALDPVLWEASNHNPIATLAGLSPQRRGALVNDTHFARLLKQAEAELRDYLTGRTWFERTAHGWRRDLRVAYFCAEYGLHESLPQYAGGLGILAGDHLKSASDLGIPLVAVGLLYRSGYYRQSFDAAGATHIVYPEYDPSRLPLSDTGRRVAVPLKKRRVQARIWLAQVGRVPLYLLDTDLPENRRGDRAITHVLYGGDQVTRIQQEIILGVGGLLALRELGHNPNVFHLNEGHAAFCILQRLSKLRQAGWSLEDAEEQVWKSTVFTTHTPVPAGHDRFPPTLVSRSLRPLIDNIGLSSEAFLALGREHPESRREPFCMTVLALGMSQGINGVSSVHGAVTRAMWQNVFEAARPEDVPIGHVTNGVHPQTWLAAEVEPLYQRHLRPRWLGAGPEHDWWRRARLIPSAELWRARNLLRRKLVAFVRQHLRQQLEAGLGSPKELAAAYESLDENALTIGFARRFATYKRATLIFRDVKRLAAILNQPRRPVQIIFAGKAHPRDAAGQALAQRVWRYARRPELRGRIIVLEDYDMRVARVLTAGCDLWLNNPIRPQEASGTSGMKAALHGGLNCSILDGWWAEACNGRNGWAISPEIQGDADSTASEQGNGPAIALGQTGGAASALAEYRTSEASSPRTAAQRDRRDAQALYTVLESEIVPLFYDRDRAGVPQRWVGRMLESMRTICGQFNTHRMVGEYVRDYYLPALES
jgi:starch phosphorylase